MLAVHVMAVVHSADLALRVFAGFCCLSTHGRLSCAAGNCIRGIDFEAALAGEEITGGYIEVVSSSTKTGRSKEKQATFLPVVLPATGLVCANWFPALLAARRQLGLLDIPAIASAEAEKGAEHVLVRL